MNAKAICNIPLLYEAINRDAGIAANNRADAVLSQQSGKGLDTVRRLGRDNDGTLLLQNFRNIHETSVLVQMARGVKS